jgi:hypothetical protein
MQVNLTTSPSIAVQAVEPPPAARPRARSADRAEFRHADALRHALDQAPDLRQDAVERARDLFHQVRYPPVEIIERISRLLASEWTGTES